MGALRSPRTGIKVGDIVKRSRAANGEARGKMQSEWLKAKCEVESEGKARGRK